MKIAIIGGGASGLYSAIFIKKKRPAYEVFVFEKENKIAKKVYATGNGHCNLLNNRLLASKFNDPSFIEPFLKEYGSSAKKTLNDLGVALLENGDYVYPLSFNAASYVLYLETLASSLGVNFIKEAEIADYQKNKEGYSIRGMSFDRVIIAVGGASSPNLGSDGSFVATLIKHGYAISPFRPGLVPLKVKEDVKTLQGVRHSARVKAKAGKEEIFDEEGEILFKKDGLSGIVIFNAESAIYRLENPTNHQVEIDLFPHETVDSLANKLSLAREANPRWFLSALLNATLAKYISEMVKDDDVFKIAKSLKNLIFHVSSSYGFMDSQVSLGGVKTFQVGPNLESKTEKGVYFAGEILNIDGFCGGFNLAWSLISALAIASDI